MGYKLGTTSKRNLKLITPPLRDVVELAIGITSQDFSVHSGARTAREQNYLYQQGRTRDGKIVTSKDGYKNKSNHQTWADGYGRALDLVPYVNGRGLVWDWELIYKIAVAMSVAAKELDVADKLRWGGNWYETMGDYGSSEVVIRQAVERYKLQHPGPDFIDGPHFEFII